MKVEDYNKVIAALSNKNGAAQMSLSNELLLEALSYLDNLSTEGWGSESRQAATLLPRLKTEILMRMKGY